MSEKTIAGKVISVNDEGYLTDPGQWTKEIAVELAKEEGVEFTDKHLEVVEFIRAKVQSGESLTIRSIGNSGKTDIKGFYTLFPGAPLKKASRIAGVPKPSSCV